MERRAVALGYERGEHAPRVLAKGRGRLADIILGIAKEHGVAVEENDALCEALMGFDAGEYITEELYEVVAQILAFVYSLRLD
jgi:flagellar biosynthesis protein